MSVYEECCDILEQEMKVHVQNVVLSYKSELESKKEIGYYLKGACSFKIERAPNGCVLMDFNMTFAGAEKAGVQLNAEEQFGFSKIVDILAPVDQNRSVIFRIRAHSLGVDCVQFKPRFHEALQFQRLFPFLLKIALEHPGVDNSEPEVIRMIPDLPE